MNFDNEMIKGISQIDFEKHFTEADDEDRVSDQMQDMEALQKLNSGYVIAFQRDAQRMPENAGHVAMNPVKGWMCIRNNQKRRGVLQQC